MATNDLPTFRISVPSKGLILQLLINKWSSIALDLHTGGPGFNAAGIALFPLT